MTSGIPTSSVTKQFIYHCRMVKLMTCSAILNEYLDSQLPSICLSTVHEICKFFDTHDFFESSEYILRKSDKNLRAPYFLNYGYSSETIDESVCGSKVVTESIVSHGVNSFLKSEVCVPYYLRLADHEYYLVGKNDTWKFNGPLFPTICFPWVTFCPKKRSSTCGQLHRNPNEWDSFESLSTVHFFSNGVVI